jgi:hypothetical protein
VTYVLPMPASQLGNPIAFLILVVTDNTLLHETPRIIVANAAVDPINHALLIALRNMVCPTAS